MGLCIVNSVYVYVGRLMIYVDSPAVIFAISRVRNCGHMIMNNKYFVELKVFDELV